MSKPDTSHHQVDKGRRDHKPWVQRTGPPISLTSFLLIALILMVTALALTASSCTTQSAVSTQNDNFTVGVPITLEVASLGGRIEVRAGSDNVVVVQAKLRDIRRIKYQAVLTGDVLEVTAEKTGKWWFPAGSTQAHIYVTVPAGTALRLETSNGKIEVTGTTRGGTLETSNGDIVLEDVKGDYEVSTSNGAVEINTIDGSAYIRTSNGKVVLQEAKGEFDAKTSNGAISFSGQMTPGGNNRLVSSNEDIKVELTGTPSVHLDASTGNGRVIHDDVAMTAVTRTETDHLIGKIGAGDAELFIETSSGDVIIK